MEMPNGTLTLSGKFDKLCMHKGVTQGNGHKGTVLLCLKTQKNRPLVSVMAAGPNGNA